MKKKFYTLLFICISLALNSSAQWQQTNGPFGSSVRSIATDGTDLYVSTSLGGFFHSTDNGVSWPDQSSDNIYYSFSDLLIDGTNLLAASGNGVVISADHGMTWTASNNGISGAAPTCFLKSGANILVGTSGTGVYASSDGGATWNYSSIGMTSANVKCLYEFGSSIFAGTTSGLYLSTDGGQNWSLSMSGIGGTEILSLTGRSTYLFAGVTGFGVYRSDDYGATWNLYSNGLLPLITM
ncbi:MAG: hypothetical protein U0X76_00990 [Bacteroidia bacterium]